jgi:hypothetical protein
VTTAQRRGRGYWIFGPEVFDFDAVDFPDDEAPMRIPTADLHGMLIELHPRGEGWALERRDGRLVRAEGGLAESLHIYEHPR